MQFDVSSGFTTPGNLESVYDTIVHSARSAQDPENLSAKEKEAQSVLEKVNGYLKHNVTEKDPFTDKLTTTTVDSQDFANYKKAVGEYQAALIKYQGTKMTFDLKDPTQQRHAQKDMASYPNVIKALQYQTSYGNDGIAFTIKSTRDNFEASQMKSQATGLPYHVSYATPSDFYNTPSTLSVTMKSADSESTHTTEAKEYGGGASFSYGLWSCGADVSSESSKDRFNSKAKNEGLSFDMSTFTITRPWMDTTLFKLDGWYMKGQDAHSISDGKSVDVQSKLMPYAPASLVLASNIKITGATGRPMTEK